MDGVLYVGEQPIAGAAAVIDWVRAENIPHLFVTNTTSRPRPALVEKLARMAINVTIDEIFTPPVAACQWLHEAGIQRIATFTTTASLSEFGDFVLTGKEESTEAVVVGDLGEGWDFATYNRAFRLLMDSARSRLVALGLTRYWRAEDGLRLDAGPFVKGLEYASGKTAVVVGKPAPSFFHAACALLNVEPRSAVMIGDDIRTDIGGAQQAGLSGVLVRTGKYRPDDLDGDIGPDVIIDDINALPDWWSALEA